MTGWKPEVIEPASAHAHRLTFSIIPETGVRPCLLF